MMLPAPGAASDGTALACDAVCAFYGRIQVIFDLSLRLGNGKLLVVLGPNGAGKSSLLGAIGGTVRGTGTIRFGGRELAHVPAHRRAQAGLSYVPEGRRNLFPSMTVQEHLELGLQLTAVGERPAVLDFTLDLFPILRQRMTAAAGMLSGGEQQMLAIALALGRRPAVLILDEPSQGLAPSVFDVLERAFAVLQQNGIAILLAEQNLAFAARVADSYVVLSHGHVVSSGNREGLSRQDEIFAAYLGGDDN
ncbi:MAG: ABC transporter ATP-binding protein [Rhodospirillales bacterium]|nr:ABC transporter ATP-binding protein [Rhodospirillales bacterium]